MDTCSATSSTSSGRPSSSSQMTSKWVDVHPRTCKFPSASQHSYNFKHTKWMLRLWIAFGHWSPLNCWKQFPCWRQNMRSLPNKAQSWHIHSSRDAACSPPAISSQRFFEICKERKKLELRQVNKCRGTSDHIACVTFLPRSMSSCQLSIQGWVSLYVTH